MQTKSENSYRRRVTLHIAFLSGFVRTKKPKLVKAIGEIIEGGWDIDGADMESLDSIFAYMDGKTMKSAIREFIAMPGKIRRADGGEQCHLCGHPYVKWLFWCRSTHEKGKGVWMGSSCIHNYSFAVDGAKTADEALRLLQKVIRDEEKKLTRAVWEVEWPTAKNQIESLNDFLGQEFDRNITRHCDPCFLGRVDRSAKGWFRLYNYYRKEGFLTETSTEKWRVIAKEAQPLYAEFEEAAIKSGILPAIVADRIAKKKKHSKRAKLALPSNW